MTLLRLSDPENLLNLIRDFYERICEGKTFPEKNFNNFIVVCQNAFCLCFKYVAKLHELLYLDVFRRGTLMSLTRLLSLSATVAIFLNPIQGGLMGPVTL